MLSRILKNIVVAFILSLILLTIGIAIRYFMKESQTPLRDILFWVGAAPIGLFTIGLFGDFLGRGDASYQLSRTAGGQSSNQRAFQDISDLKSKVKSGVNWILAGLFVWLYSVVL